MHEPGTLHSFNSDLVKEVCLYNLKAFKYVKIQRHVIAFKYENTHIMIITKKMQPRYRETVIKIYHQAMSKKTRH